MKKLENLLTATSCVPQPHAASWSAWNDHATSLNDGLVAFAAGPLVGIYQPGAAQSVRLVMQGHTERVNCVQWINRPTAAKNDYQQSNSLMMVSVSADHSLCLWRINNQLSAYELLHRDTQTHTAPVHALAVLVNTAESILLATAGSDRLIVIWSFAIERNELRAVQKIQPRKGHAVSLAFTLLSGTVPLLAAGTTDSQITLYTQDNDDGLFTAKISLKGHTDWVRSMDFIQYNRLGNSYHESADILDGDLLLASASQDKFIRVWKITKNVKRCEDPLLSPLTAAAEEELNTKAHTFSVAAINHAQQSSLEYAVYLESVLTGHDDWVYTVQWHPRLAGLDQNGDFHHYHPAVLLSASADNTVIIWYPDQQTGVWTHEAQLGDPHKNILGIYGALWSPDGRQIVGHGRNGGFHLWKLAVSMDATEVSGSTNSPNQFIQCGSRRWNSSPSGLTGHFRPVTDLTWDTTGRYLVTVSLDQTTRVWAQYPTRTDMFMWREVNRAQVHGYDLRCVTSMDRWRFASGADGEKMSRVFIANRPFGQTIAKLYPAASAGDQGVDSLALGASIPALGLSNRALPEQGGPEVPLDNPATGGERNMLKDFLETQEKMQLVLLEQKSSEFQSSGGHQDRSAPEEPTEEHLAQYTLWSEQEKLYGHGYELYTMTALAPQGDPSGEGVLATACACRAANSKDASIRLWSSRELKPIQQPLESHTLTVTRMKFSSDGQFLVSVGRDRVWSLFQRQQSGEWILAARLPEAHSRIIWDVVWTQDDCHFITASRDKLVKMWRIYSRQNSSVVVELVATWKFDESVTAIDCLTVGSIDLIALGFENGSIQVFNLQYDGTGKSAASINLIARIERGTDHFGTVKRISFRTEITSDGQRRPVSSTDSTVELASCGDDQTVRLYKMYL